MSFVRYVLPLCSTPTRARSRAKPRAHRRRRRCRRSVQYALHTDDLPKYLALTGSDAFKARTEASPLLGFFLVETGGQLNRVVHFWEYDDLDHRTAVRKMLAGDKGFGEYFSQIRPWLAFQTSVLVRPSHFDPTNAAAGPNGPFFALQQCAPGAALAAPSGDVALVGQWTEVLGSVGTQYQLFSAATYQKLVAEPALAAPSSSTTLMAPTPFSPMQ
jgi:hypothetical protein